jgi:hypothetical protein
MTNKLRPKIKSPKIDNILDYYNELVLTIQPEENFLSIESDFKQLLTTGLANENVTSFFRSNESDYHYSPSMNLLSMMRYKYIREFGFTLLSEGVVEHLTSQLKDKKVLEVGAGSGFLSSCLKNNNIDITPVDAHHVDVNSYGFKTPYTDIVVTNAIDYLKESFNQEPFEVIIMSWPNYDNSFASDILQHMQSGQTLYYSGESYGGCTGDDTFFSLLETKTTLNEELTNHLQLEGLHWDGLHDRWYVYTIN